VKSLPFCGRLGRTRSSHALANLLKLGFIRRCIAGLQPNLLPETDQFPYSVPVLCRLIAQSPESVRAPTMPVVVY